MRKEKLKKSAVTVLSLALSLACQHTALDSEKAAAASRPQPCTTKPISLEISEKTPIFDDKSLPQGILLFDEATVYMEKLDEQGDVVEKVHLTEQYTTPKKENLAVNIHCVQGQGDKIVSDFNSAIPALKKIEINEKGNRLVSNNFEVKVDRGQVSYTSQLPTEPTKTSSVREFFATFGVNYAFYKVNEKTYEFRGHKRQDGISSYIAVKYQLISVN